MRIARLVCGGHIGQHVNALAALIVFLCSAAGDGINGAMLPMEGGWLAG